MKHILHRQVFFRDALGWRFSLGPGEYLALMRHSTTQAYLAIVYVILVATDAPGLFGKLSLATTLGIWAIVMGLFLVLLGVCVLLLAALQDRVGAFTSPGPVLACCAVLPAVAVGDWLMQMSAQVTVGFQVFPQVLFYLVIVEGFGTIFLRYIRPTLEHEMRTAPEPLSQMSPQTTAVGAPSNDTVRDTQDDTEGDAAEIAARSIVIGAEPVPLSALHHIQAREHHVHVTMEGRSLTQRARLSDIVAQTTPGDGLQPHRSWWVAGHAARRLDRVGQKHVLELADGTQVPVARSRLDDVRAWLAQNA